MSGRNILYREFYNTYKVRFKSNFKNGTELQQACNDIWRKRSTEEAHAYIAQWKAEINEYEAKMMCYNAISDSVDEANASKEMKQEEEEDNEKEASPSPTSNKIKRRKPAQEKLEGQISELKNELFDLYQIEQHRALTPEEMQKRYCCLEELKPLDKRLNSLKAFARRSIAFREREKKLMKQIFSKASLRGGDSNDTDGKPSTSKQSASPASVEEGDRPSHTPSPPTIVKPKPAQEKIEEQIEELKGKIFNYDELEAEGKMEGMETKERESYMKQLVSLEKKLRHLQTSAQLNQARRRVKKKMLLNLLADPQNQDLVGIKKFRTTTGRPSLEDEQPGLKQAIFDIIGVETNAEAEILTINMSLGELQKQLKDKGFNISKSSLCNRFHPANPDSRDPKRKKCLPFRLMKPQHPKNESASQKTQQEAWPSQVVQPQNPYYSTFSSYGQMKDVPGIPEDYSSHF